MCACWWPFNFSSSLSEIYIYIYIYIYYNTTTATNRCLLLQSGDINPNPGPTHCEPNSTSPHHSSGRQLCYDVSNLHNLQPTSKCHYGLCKETWSTIDSLGIARKRKTHRGRRSSKSLHFKQITKDDCKLNDPLPIDTRATNRESCVSRAGNSTLNGRNKKRNVISLPQTGI